MIIREMEQKDKSTILNMMRGFYDSPAVIHKVTNDVLEKDIEDCIGECPYIEGVVFEEANVLAGYAMIAKSYSTEFGGLCIWIEDLYIEPEFQGKGVGTSFFQYLEDKYRGIAVRYRLEVAKDNIGAIRVYQKCGYKELSYVEMTKE